MTVRSALLVALCVLGPAAQAASPAPLAQLPSAHLRVEADGSLRAGDGRLIARLTIGDAAPDAATLRALAAPLAGHIEVRARKRSLGRTLLLRPDGAVLYDEPFGPGADGELVRHVEIAADGPRRWQETQGVSRCDLRLPLFLERFDLKTHSWSRAALPVPDAPTLPSSAGPAIVAARALRFSAASNDGRSERADYLGAPRELDDGAPEQALLLGEGPQVTGAFFTARAPREVPLVAVRIDPPPAPARLPHALVLIGGSPALARHRLVLSGRAAQTFRLPSALRGACVSFVVDDDGAAPIGIGEIALQIGDEGVGALSAHARSVAAQDGDSEGSARALEDAGRAGAEAALAAVPDAQPAGRRRLLSVVYALRGRLPAALAPRLFTLLQTAHAEERVLLVESLAALGPASFEGAVRLLGDRAQAAETRADAVGLLARLTANTPAAVPIIVDAILDEEKLVARAARDATHTSRDDAYGQEIVRRLTALPIEAPTGPTAAIAETLIAALGTPRSEETRAAAVAAIERLGPVERLPFALAVRVLSVAVQLDPALALRRGAAVLQHGSDPTLRLVAVAKLPETKDAALGLVLSSAAKDPDARVREAALTRLAAVSDGATDALFLARLEDLWPSVRRVAYGALGARCAAAPSLDAALAARVFDPRRGDPDGRARADALAAWAHCSSAADERLAKAIAPKQPSEVRERAAQLLAGRGPRVVPLLGKTLDKVFSRGGAELPDTAVALLSAIGRAGAGLTEQGLGDDVLALLRDAAADPFYPTVRIAALQALASGCPRGARNVFERSAADPEPAVQRAAALARLRCDR